MGNSPMLYIGSNELSELFEKSAAAAAAACCCKMLAEVVRFLVVVVEDDGVGERECE